jgi:nitroreductase
MPHTSGRRKAFTNAVVAGAYGAGTLVSGFVFWRAWRNRIWRVGAGPAYESWRRWLREGHSRSLIQAATLAANAHNSQPWRFHVAAETIAIVADLDRHLGCVDPFRRELHLSLGCALENLVQAARGQALSTIVTLPPGRLELAPPNRPRDAAAIVRLTPALQADTTLYDAIPHRHTHRGAYDRRREIPEPLLGEMRSLVPTEAPLRLFLFTRAARLPLGELIVDATRAIVNDAPMATDHARWLRFDWQAIQRQGDGLTVDASLTSPLSRVLAKMRPPSIARALRQWVRETRDIHVGTAPLLGIIAVRNLYDRPGALQAGRLWQRLHLWMTSRGLVAQPLNQPVVRVDRERALQAGDHTAEALAHMTGAPEWHPTLIFRAGYADRRAAASPRREIDAVLAH